MNLLVAVLLTVMTSCRHQVVIGAIVTACFGCGKGPLCDSQEEIFDYQICTPAMPPTVVKGRVSFRFACAIWTDGNRGCVPKDQCKKKGAVANDGKTPQINASNVTANNSDYANHQVLLINQRDVSSVSQREEEPSDILYCCDENFCNNRIPTPAEEFYQPYVALSLTAIALIGVLGVALAMYGLVKTFHSVRKDHYMTPVNGGSFSGAGKTNENGLQATESWPSEFVLKDQQSLA